MYIILPWVNAICIIKGCFYIFILLFTFCISKEVEASKKIYAKGFAIDS